MPEIGTTKKAPAKRKYQAGECFSCKLCGLSVTVDENFAYTEKSRLTCCDTPMELKGKKSPAAGK
jgi:hypothetical protein